jgi:outer membrane lipoprotein-sorting protein
MKRIKLITFLVTLWLTVPTLAQSNQVSNVTANKSEKAEQIIQRAIEAMGGKYYLGVRSLYGNGRYTQYQDGVSGIPIKFVDYLIYPDKERLEFSGQGVRSIEVHNGRNGWVYDGMMNKIKDLEKSQIESFQNSVRTSIENLLHGWWKKDKAELSYIGRREAGIGKRNEVIKLTYADGFSVEYEFGAKDGLPAKVVYQRKSKEGEEEETTEETHFAQFVMLDGVTTPLVIDHFRDGKQTSRINFEVIKFNHPIMDKIFDRPASVKELK